MIISLIFVVVSLSTIDADKHSSKISSRQLVDFDSGMIIQLYPNQIQYCNKLWYSIKVLPRPVQSNFFKIMTALVRVEEIFQPLGKKSKITKNNNYINNKNKKISDQSFHDFCRSVWERVDDFTPKSQTRIKNRLLGLIEDAKNNLAHNKPALPEELFNNEDDEPEFGGDELSQTIKNQILDNVYNAYTDYKGGDVPVFRQY